MNRDLHAHLIDGLYVEAMIMADEARAYFDRHGEADREGLAMVARIAFSCESLKVTTRLMHVIAWLLTQRAWQRGEIDDMALRHPKYRLGESAATDAAVIKDFPFATRALIEGSTDLYDRVARIEGQIDRDCPEADPPVGPARALLRRLERAF